MTDKEWADKMNKQELLIHLNDMGFLTFPCVEFIETFWVENERP